MRENAVAVAANAITAGRKAEPPGPWSSEVYTELLALAHRAVTQLGHLTMNYQCEDCLFEWEVYCSLGCEGPPELKAKDLAVAVPFCIGCPAYRHRRKGDAEPFYPDLPAVPCDGTMTHIRWLDDRTLAPPQLIPEDAPRFVLPQTAGDQMCGRLEIPTQALVRARRAWESDDSTQNSDAG